METINSLLDTFISEVTELKQKNTEYEQLIERLKNEIYYMQGCTNELRLIIHKLELENSKLTQQPE